MNIKKAVFITLCFIAVLTIIIIITNFHRSPLTSDEAYRKAVEKSIPNSSTDYSCYQLSITYPDLKINGFMWPKYGYSFVFNKGNEHNYYTNGVSVDTRTGKIKVYYDRPDIFTLTKEEAAELGSITTNNTISPNEIINIINLFIKEDILKLCFESFEEFHYSCLYLQDNQIFASFINKNDASSLEFVLDATTHEIIQTYNKTSLEVVPSTNTPTP